MFVLCSVSIYIHMQVHRLPQYFVFSLSTYSTSVSLSPLFLLPLPLLAFPLISISSVTFSLCHCLSLSHSLTLFPSPHLLRNPFMLSASSLPSPLPHPGLVPPTLLQVYGTRVQSSITALTRGSCWPATAQSLRHVCAGAPKPLLSDDPLTEEVR